MNALRQGVRGGGVYNNPWNSAFASTATPNRRVRDSFATAAHIDDFDRLSAVCAVPYKSV